MFAWPGSSSKVVIIPEQICYHEFVQKLVAISVQNTTRYEIIVGMTIACIGSVYRSSALLLKKVVLAIVMLLPLSS